MFPGNHNPRKAHGRSPDQQSASNQQRLRRRLSGPAHAIALQSPEVQRTSRGVGVFQYPGVSKAITIFVDLRVEHDLKLVVQHGKSAANIQVIRLAHRPAGFNGRRWYFVSEKGERAETLFLVGGRFRTRREAELTYRSQSMGELDRMLERKRKIEAQLKGTSARGPARGRRRKQAEEKLEEIVNFLNGFEWRLVHRDQNRCAQARERRRRSLTGWRLPALQ